MFLMNCCGPLMEMKFTCSALNFMYIVTFSIDKPHVDFVQLHHDTNKPLRFIVHLEATCNYCGHFFNLYINLHLEDFDFFTNASKLHLLLILVMKFLIMCLLLCFLLYLIQVSILVLMLLLLHLFFLVRLICL